MKRATLLGALAGVIAGTLLTAALFVRDRRGWDPVPMMVFASDLEAGLELNHESVTRRLVPSGFVFPGAVAAGEASSFAGRTALVKTETGAPVMDAHFATAERCAAWRRLCADAERSSPDQVPVLFAARDIEEGHPLTAEDLAEKPVPAHLWTRGEPMFIRARFPTGATPAVLGWVALAPIKAGDPVLHGYFDVPRLNGR